MAADLGLYTLPIPCRPPRTWSQTLNAFLFASVFNLGCLMINATQFVFLLPLRLFPFNWARQSYDEGIRYTKGAFATLLILMSQWFAPTQLVLTFEKHGQGRFTEEDIERIVVRDKMGNVVCLDLPNRSVIIANHQVYADWWYAWCLTYFMGTHKDVFIVLKQSLKWVPVVGWGMQFFNFIFLARSWASDRVQLASQLSALGRQAEQKNKPLSLILYPEGTLVSTHTRPVSKKFADKLGIDDMAHTLLPRATGLHYSLRSLAPRIPTLKLIDITMVYPGIPPMGYGQSYYTLRSIFFDRCPPPVISIHLRCFDVATDVPIGDISATNPSILSIRSPNTQAVEVDFPEDEKARFELWLRKLWREKDQLISKFHKTGSFVSDAEGAEKNSVQIPLVLRDNREILDAFCFFVPAAIGLVWAKLKRTQL